jgi:hypothetical protein
MVSSRQTTLTGGSAKRELILTRIHFPFAQPGRFELEDSPMKRRPEFSRRSFLIAKPRLLPAEDFSDFTMPEGERANHWHEFVDAIPGKGRTQANFDYAGPLTEAVLLGSVASRFPKTTLNWEATKLRFTNVKEANQFVRRKYHKRREVPNCRKRIRPARFQQPCP